MGSVSMAEDMGESLRAVVRSDSSAALAISQRVGLGKVRHREVQYLSIQERHSNKQLDLRKVKGEQNPADMLTKGVPQEVFNRHLAASGMEAWGARAVVRCLRCERSAGGRLSWRRSRCLSPVAHWRTCAAHGLSAQMFGVWRLTSWRETRVDRRREVPAWATVTARLWEP